jgi:23S rRNA pseudouridine1911/1915/1917 synthase
LVASVIKLSSPETREYWEVPVVYEDQSLLVLDKPARMPVSPDRADPARPNLMGFLHRDIQRGARWAVERGLQYLANAHRLDSDASGILVLAKSKPALVHLANQFGSERPERTYAVLVYGVPEEESFEVTLRIGPHPTRPGVMKAHPKLGKKAATRFSLDERAGACSLLLASPLTARTHQIRVHLQSCRLPMVGDRIYGGRPLFLSDLKPDYRPKPNQEERPLMGRAALHAGRLVIQHPSTGAELALEVALPKDFTVALKYLNRFG